MLAPVVVSAWPAFSAAVVSAAASMGYVVAESSVSALLGGSETVCQPQSVDLDVPNSRIVSDGLGRDQHLSVTREGVTVTFSRDARGRAGLCVTGTSQTAEELRTAGEELSRRVVQRYVHQRLMQEMEARGYLVVEETTDANQAIRLRVRHWEN